MKSYKFKDNDFQCYLNLTGLYLIARKNVDLAVQEAQYVMEDLILERDQMVLIVIIAEDEEVQKSKYLNLVHEAEVENLLESKFKNRSKVFNEKDITEILECYELTEKELEKLETKKTVVEERIEESKQLEICEEEPSDSEWYYDYSRTVLYKRLQVFRISKSKDIKSNGFDILTDKQLEEIVKRRPTAIEELRQLGVHEEDFLDVSYLVELCPIEDPVRRRKDSNLEEYEVKEKGDFDGNLVTEFRNKGILCSYVGVALLTVAIIFLFLNLPWYLSLIFLLFSWQSFTGAKLLFHSKISSYGRLICTIFVIFIIVHFVF